MADKTLFSSPFERKSPAGEGYALQQRSDRGSPHEGASWGYALLFSLEGKRAPSEIVLSRKLEIVLRESLPPHLVSLYPTMAKRKAEGSHRAGKAPERPPPTRQPPPPPQEDDSSDSDVCEIVSPPPSTNPPRQKPRQKQRPPSVGFSPASGSHPQAQASAGLLSMMSGMPAAGFGLSAAGQGAHFGYQPVQASNGFNPFLFAAPQLFPPQAGVQGGFFPGAPSSLSAGASSGGGASSGASEVGECSQF